MALTAPQNVQVKSKFGFPWGTKAPNNRNIAPVLLSFASCDNWTVDASLIQGNVDQFPILGIMVDNSENPNALSFNCGPPINQTFTIPAGAIARLPIEAGTPVKLVVTSPATFNGTVLLLLLNYAPQPVVWYPNTPNSLSQPAAYTPLGYVQVNPLSAVSPYTLAPPAGAVAALIIPETTAVRWRDDGVAPTSAVGMPVSVGQTVTFNENLSAIQFIAEGAGAVLNIAYYKY